MEHKLISNLKNDILDTVKIIINSDEIQKKYKEFLNSNTCGDNSKIVSKLFNYGLENLMQELDNKKIELDVAENQSGNKLPQDREKSSNDQNESKFVSKTTFSKIPFVNDAVQQFSTFFPDMKITKHFISKLEDSFEMGQAHIDRLKLKILRKKIQEYIQQEKEVARSIFDLLDEWVDIAKDNLKASENNQAVQSSGPKTQSVNKIQSVNTNIKEEDENMKIKNGISLVVLSDDSNDSPKKKFKVSSNSNSVIATDSELFVPTAFVNTTDTTVGADAIASNSVQFNIENLSFADKEYYNSLPEKSKDWLKKKAQFVIKILPDTSVEYIISRLIFCKNDDEVANIVEVIMTENTFSEKSVSNNKSNSLNPMSFEPVAGTSANVNLFNTFFDDSSLSVVTKCSEKAEHNVQLKNEAKLISNLIPFFTIDEVLKKLIKYQECPDRKLKVLEKFNRHAKKNKIPTDLKVSETLLEWYETFSDVNHEKPELSFSENEETPTKRRKVLDISCTSTAVPEAPALTIGTEACSVMEAVAHLGIEAAEGHSHHAVTDKTENIEKKDSLNNTQSSNDISFSFKNLPHEDKEYYNSVPERTKDWLKEKVKFAAEIIPNAPADYILSRILFCQNDNEVANIIEHIMTENNFLEKLSLENSSIKSTVPEKSKSVASSSKVADPIYIRLNEPTSTSSANTGAIPKQLVIEKNVNETASGSDDSNSSFEDLIDSHIKSLTELFPDCDPDYLTEKANEVGKDEAKFQTVVYDLTENKNYPKLVDYQERQKSLKLRQKFIEGMDVDEFLQYFENPEKTFSDTSYTSPYYPRAARIQLMNDFPSHLCCVVDRILRKHNGHYYPSYKVLHALDQTRRTKRPRQTLPTNLDDFFLKERCWVRLEPKMKEHEANKKYEKELAFKKAKQNSELKECQCCYDDEVMPDDMMACQNQEHNYCTTCIRRFCEEQIGQGKVVLQCIETDCKFEFPLPVLKAVLNTKFFSNLLRKKQAEEVAAAGIEDLETCPFCDFATIMPNKDDKVFKCLNPECFKDSCRLCKEKNHVPLRCEEVEKKNQTRARTFLENEMTEAMIRECPKCKKRFIKEEGCNKMVCSCGAIMCYLCKTAIKGYDHFDNNSSSTQKFKNGKCPLYSNSIVLHEEEVVKRAEEAKKKLDPHLLEFMQDDPTKDLKKSVDRKHRSAVPPRPPPLPLQQAARPQRPQAARPQRHQNDIPRRPPLPERHQCGIRPPPNVVFPEQAGLPARHHAARPGVVHRYFAARNQAPRPAPSLPLRHQAAGPAPSLIARYEAAGPAPPLPVRYQAAEPAPPLSLRYQADFGFAVAPRLPPGLQYGAVPGGARNPMREWYDRSAPYNGPQ